MEPSVKTTGESRILSILAGMVFGCLSALLLMICLVGGLATLAIRLSAGRWDAGRAGNNSRQPSADLSGAAIFADRCSHCHSTGAAQKYGPGLAGLFSPGGPQLPDGVDYAGRLPNGKEITEASVAEWIRSGGRGAIGAMPAQRLTDAQMDHLIEYLKTLK